MPAKSAASNVTPRSVDPQAFDAKSAIEAFDALSEMENPLMTIFDLANALEIMAPELGEDESCSVYRIASIIKSQCREVKEFRGEAWHKLHKFKFPKAQSR
ncbi:hypothetical protein [Xanthobacter sp. KR7-225]|uniref:hypothetical protein n=1 Tax=Xanthobacter sp. KR7-225 TaxID=3156613 RepID=UPI0032B5798A